MTGPELEKFGKALFGADWRRPFEREFGVSNRTLRRLLKGDEEVRPDLAQRVQSAARFRFGQIVEAMKS